MFLDGRWKFNRNSTIPSDGWFFLSLEAVCQFLIIRSRCMELSFYFSNIESFNSVIDTSSLSYRIVAQYTEDFKNCWNNYWMQEYQPWQLGNLLVQSTLLTGCFSYVTGFNSIRGLDWGLLVMVNTYSISFHNSAY